MNKLAALCFGIGDIYKNESNTKEQEVLSFLRKVLNYDVKLFFVSQSKENKIEANDIVRDTEDVIYCSSPNAFLDSDLDKHLKKNEISHIILLGKMYPMVMEATSYNAYFHGYQVIALEDMMISETNEEKQDFFSWFNLYFGLTYTYDDLFKAIETGDVFTVKDVEIPEGSFTDIYGNTNDTLKKEFITRGSEYYSSIIMNLSGVKNPNSILQLLNSKEKVLEEHKVTGNTIITINYLAPGTYKCKLFYDENGNGVWDTGNYKEQRQPEKVFYFGRNIETKSGWDMEYTWIVE